MRQSLLNTAVLVGLASAAQAQTWTNGAGDQAWENGANWSGGVVPQTGTTHINTATAGQTPILTTAVSLTTADTFVGDGTAGVLDINAGGSIDSSSKWFFVGNASGGDGTLNVNSGGSFTSDNDIRVGRAGAIGHLNVASGGSINVDSIVFDNAASTSSITGNANIATVSGSTLRNLTATGFSGNVNIQGGDIEFQSGASDIAGGSLAASGQVFVGRSEVGQLAVSSGNVNSGAWFVVGIGAGGNGTLNLTNGTINSSQTSGFTTIGAGGGIGEVNQSGGTWNEANKTVLGENSGGTGTYNLNGGVLKTGAVEDGAGTGILNFGGGTLRAGRDEANFINASTSVVINSGGGTIDSNGFEVTVNANLTGAGGLDKDGTGSVNLAGAGNSLNTVSVSTGTLFISGALGTLNGTTVGPDGSIGAGDLDGGALSGDLMVNAGGTIDITKGLLTVSSGTVSFGGFGFGDIIGFDVNTAENGTYTLLDGDFTLDSSNIANFGAGNALDLGGGRSAYFGEGSLTAVVVPEPGVALLGSLGLLGLLRRRRG